MTTKLFEHPEYLARVDEWRVSRDLYEGKHSVLTGPEYLWMHELESSVEAYKEIENVVVQTVGQHLRALRAKRSRYLNLFEPMVSTWISMLFREELSYDPEVKELLGEDGLADIDGAGTSFEDFIKNHVALAYFRDGQPWIMVDAPQGDFASLAEQEGSRHRPYMELLDVMLVKDWQISGAGPNFGKYQLLRFEYEEIEARTSLTEAPVMGKYCKVLMLTNVGYEVELFQMVDNQWQTRGIQTVGKVEKGWDTLPISTIKNNDPWVRDLAEIALALFNEMSAWFNLLNTQAFQRVILSGSFSPQHKFAISEYAWGVAPPGTTTTVIDSAPTAQHTDAIDRLIDMFYRVGFNRTRGLSAGSDEAPSANTLREMNIELITILKTAATEIESVVNNALKHVALFKGKKDFKGKIQISKNFAPEDVEAATTRWLAYKDDIKKVDPWYKAELKRLAEQEGFSEEEEKEIFEAIEKLEAASLMDPLKGFGAFINDGPKGTEQAGDDEDQEPRGSSGSPDRAAESVPGA